MRRLLGVLREDTRADAGQRQPQPSLSQLNELLDEARDASGSGIRLIVAGPMAALDPGVELRRLPHRPGGAHQRPAGMRQAPLSTWS